MRRHAYALSFALFLLVAAVGCGNPMKRDPANVFPGSDAYVKRVKSFKISPPEAYEIALAKAKAENKMQFLSRRPTVIVKRWYVFSLPQSSGADLQGFHVNGDSGEVKFVSEKKTIPHSKR